MTQIGEQKPHILHLMATEFVGGPEKQILTHLRYVDRNRYQVTVGSYLESGRPNGFLRAATQLGVPTLALPQNMPMDPRLVGELRRNLESRRIDVLITHGYKSNVVGHLANKGQLPHAMYIRGWTAESRRVKFYHWLERRFFSRARLLVTVARQKARDLEHMGFAPNRIRVIENAVEDEPLEKPPQPLREQFGIPADHSILLAAGRLSPEKGHRVLVEAMEIVKRSNLPVSAVVFGEGPEETSLSRSIASRGLEATCLLAGFSSGWRRHLPEARAVVNPSFSEVMPNVVLEAMIHRCPVIATRVGGVPELIPDASMGRIIEPGNPEALARAIRDVCVPGKDLSSMTEAAYDQAKRNFTFEAQAQKLHHLYHELLS